MNSFCQHIQPKEEFSFLSAIVSDSIIGGESRWDVSPHQPFQVVVLLAHKICGDKFFVVQMISLASSGVLRIKF